MSKYLFLSKYEDGTLFNLLPEKEINNKNDIIKILDFFIKDDKKLKKLEIFLQEENGKWNNYSNF